MPMYQYKCQGWRS